MWVRFGMEAEARGLEPGVVGKASDHRDQLGGVLLIELAPLHRFDRDGVGEEPGDDVHEPAEQEGDDQAALSPLAAHEHEEAHEASHKEHGLEVILERDHGVPS